MPTLNLTLAGSPPETLRVSHSILLKAAEVTLNGQRLHAFASREELVAGRSWTLANGDTLCIRLVSAGFGGHAVEITQNGLPVPGSATHPGTKIKSAAAVLGFVAGVTGVLGLTRLFGSEGASEGIGMLVEAAIFGAFSWLTFKRRRWALGAGSILYLVESVFAVLNGFGAGGSPISSGIVVRVVFVMILVRGFLAFRDLGKFDTNAALADFR